MMIDPVADCQVLICGGMGKGAFDNIIERNINPIVTEIANIDQAIDVFSTGELESRPQRLH